MNRKELIALLVLSVSVGAGVLVFPTTVNNFKPDIPMPITGDVLPVALKEFVPEGVRSTSTLFIVGDVMLARHVEFLMSAHKSTYPYTQLDFLLEEPAYVIGNFEAAMPVMHNKTPNFGFAFSVKPEVLPALRRAGFTHMSLANNHAYDYGVRGYKNALEQLTTNGIAPFGHPSDVSGSTSVSMLNLGDTTVGILALHTLNIRPDRMSLLPVTESLNEATDFQIAYIHWGNEYERRPAQLDRDLATTLAELGVDLVVGHHPHVVQSIERIGETVVFYSLGNFIFDQYFSQDVQEGLVLKLQATAVGVDIELLPVSSLRTPAQPRPMSQNETEDFLQRLATISDEDLTESILSGKITLPWSLATSKETAMMSQ
jgi:gamma-polyglutamate biosynthesis protein CapA